MTQEDIARALGVDAGTVSRDRRRGMPVDSVEAARAWRAQHIRPRMPRVPLAPPAQSPGPAQPSLACTAAQALAGHAGDLLERGESITALVPALRAALRAVPDAERPGLALPLGVFELLTRDVLALVQAESPGDAGEVSDADAEWLGAFWFAAAAGEVRPA